MAVAREIGSRNITCNAVAPGFIETAMTSALSDEIRQSALKAIPLNRVGTAEEVANCVAFLASEEAGDITRHLLDVNGGVVVGVVWAFVSSVNNHKVYVLHGWV